MAEIPVEKRSRMPWWIWVLALLLLAGIIWWIVDDDADEVAVVPPAAVEPVVPMAPVDPAAAGSEITDPLVIVAVPDRLPLVGRTVRLTAVEVQDVIGDQAFWIGPDENQRVLVAMQEVPPPGYPTDADIDINPGQTINLVGQVRRMPALAGEDLARTETAFGEAFARAAQDEQVYIFAQAADVVARP